MSRPDRDDRPFSGPLSRAQAGVPGNTSESVKIRVRPVSEVVGYGYPDYTR